MKIDVCLSRWENCRMGFCHSACCCAAAQRAFCRQQPELVIKPLSLQVLFWSSSSYLFQLR